MNQFWGKILAFIIVEIRLTLKKSFVDPASKVPYRISVCLARSSADSIGVNMRSTVKKAARLAVYEDMMMSVKNHHTLPTIRPDMDLHGFTALDRRTRQFTNQHSTKKNGEKLPVTWPTSILNIICLPL